MASSSPYQNNDYQAVSTFRPYQLPINDIFKAISAQNQFWDEGARRVKSVYDNALGLDLTLEENREVRDNFMKEAEKQITKLSSMDLSDPSVQRQGFGIFQPLFKDSAILQDDHITKRQRQIFQEAEQYKRKGNGEGFHPDNLAYAMMPFKGFGKDTSRHEVGEIFERSKGAEYIPYHDVSKEYLDVASKCKPDEYSSNSIQGLYFRSSEDTSQTATNVMGCIKAGISDKAWQQLKITGSVRYGDNIGAVAKGFAPIVIGENNSNAQRLLEIAAERKKLKDAGALGIDVEKAYDTEIGQINKTIIENTGILQRIARNDFSDVAKNYENIVSQVYANQDIGGFAAAFAYRKHKEEYKTNPAGIAQYTQGNINARQTQMLKNQNYWKAKDLEIDQAKLQMDQNKNDIEMMKSLLGGTGTKGLTTGGADYQMLLPIMQRLGIDPGITQEMPISEKIEGVGITAEQIREKADQFHNERLSAATGMYNILKRVVGKENIEALNKEVYNAQGVLNTDAIYKKADKFLNTYHTTPGTANSDDIAALENSANEYSSASAKVMNWMRARDEVSARLARGESPINVLQDVNNILQSRLKYGLGNIPGLANSIRKEFTGSMQEYQGEEFEFRPGDGYQDANGDFVTEVKVFKKTKTKEDEVTQTTDADVTEDLIKKLDAKDYPMNSMNNIIYDKEKGILKVKTPYLPVAQKEYELKQEVGNHIWMNRNVPLANQENFSIPLKHIPGTGGFKTGFDIIGNGFDGNSREKPKTFRAWYMTPDGSKEYFGDPTPQENLLSNQLSLLEKSAQRLAEGYRAAAKKKK